MARIKRVRIVLDRTVVLSVGVSLAAPLVARTTLKVLNRTKVLTPVRTGNLRSANRMVMRARRTYVSGTVENRVKYATWVHEGTRPHLIRARRRQFLRFEAPPGTVHFRRVVRHPGTKPRPFMRQALYDVAEPAGFKVTGGATGFLMSETP